MEERYKVSPGNIYRCSLSYLSQPINYLAVSLVLHCSMIVYFAVTVKENKTPVIVTTAILYAATAALHIIFPFVDPGVVPSILQDFEAGVNQGIPFDREISRSR